MGRIRIVLAIALLSSSAPMVRADTDASSTRPAVAHVQLLGINDFHGTLRGNGRIRGRPAGGAAVLGAYLRDARARFGGGTLIVHAGDHVGASPPSSGLLQDEPAIQFLNLLANRFCKPSQRLDPRCDVVGTLGNHEFDEGVAELLRLAQGGNAVKGPFLEAPWRGAHFPLVSANVIERKSKRPLLPAYVVKTVAGVRLGVIGAVVRDAPSMVVASGVQRVSFRDEAEAINEAVRALVRRGIATIVVTIHQGGEQPPYEGPTRVDAKGPDGAIAQIVGQLDDAVDVVISGHAHAFTNALMPTRSGHSILVTQALSAGLAYADVALTIDRASGDVLEKSARIVATYHDTGPGLTPAADVATLVEAAERAVLPLTERVIGHASAAFVAQPNEAGESALGNLVADAQREASGAQIAFMNQGGIRTGLDAGAVTWGELCALHPFGNVLVTMELSGAQVLAILEQQWRASPPRLLHAAGLSYVWDPKRPIGSRVIASAVSGVPLAPEARYRVVTNNFLAEGGGDFAAFREGTERSVAGSDLDALARFIQARGAPLVPTLDGRVRTP